MQNLRRGRVLGSAVARMPATPCDQDTACRAVSVLPCTDPHRRRGVVARLRADGAAQLAHEAGDRHGEQHREEHDEPGGAAPAAAGRAVPAGTRRRAGPDAPARTGCRRRQRKPGRGRHGRRMSWQASESCSGPMPTPRTDRRRGPRSRSARPRHAAPESPRRSERRTWRVETPSCEATCGRESGAAPRTAGAHGQHLAVDGRDRRHALLELLEGRAQLLARPPPRAWAEDRRRRATGAADAPAAEGHSPEPLPPGPAVPPGPPPPSNAGESLERGVRPARPSCRRPPAAPPTGNAPDRALHARDGVAGRTARASNRRGQRRPTVAADRAATA